MKNIFALALLVFTSQLITAQENNKNTYYLTSEYDIGNYFGVDLNLNYVIKNKYALKVGFTGNVRKPKGQPEDYSGGLNGLFSVFTSNPYDYFTTYKLILEESTISTKKEL